MKQFIKSAVLVVAGMCWLGFAVFICVLLYGYLTGGAGLQVFGFFLGLSSMTVLVGLVHFVGFVAAACLCFVIGAGLFAHGIAPPPENRVPEERIKIDDAGSV